jgi:hypothetical protein
MIIEAIISSTDGEHLKQGDIFSVTNESRNGKRFKVDLGNIEATEISEEITRLSALDGRDVRAGKNLYLKLSVDNPQGFYHGLSNAGMVLVDSRISYEGGER